MAGVLDRVREYWDADAATYDRSHGLGSAAERAAWNAALTRMLPPPPASVLDVGAGTGFLSLLLAELGYRVTALDLSPGMLDRLRGTAEQRGLDIATVTRPAHQPPDGPFDAIVERHLMWLLLDAPQTLAAWRRAAPAGRLVAVEGSWGRADPAQRRRHQAREALRRARRLPPAHHASADPQLHELLPFGRGITPDEICAAMESAGWRTPRLERLRDVEWVRTLALAPAERLLGTTPQYAVVSV